MAQTNTAVKNNTSKKKASKRDKVSKTNKAKKYFTKTANKLKDVFQNKSHENQYTELINDGDEDVVSIESHSDSGKDFTEARHEAANAIVLNDDDVSDDGDDAKSDVRSVQTAPQPNTMSLPQKAKNELVENSDFISLKFSDSEEDEDEKEDDELDNEEDAYSMDDDETDLYPDRPKVNSETPWIKDHDHSTQREVADWLTMEIKDFIAYISPSKEEIELRNSTVRRLREKISKFWTDCEVQVFGSYATDLYLPGSDIDMVIISPNGQYDNRNALYQLSSFLKRENLATNVEVISKTKVPIIKFNEKRSGIHIDVSFERTNGVEAAKIIRNWLQETPGLRELVLIVKQFLNARRLNNVRVGGLGGYSIICLCYSFLSLHPRLKTGNISAMENLGVLLIEFFELYGKNFSYDDVAICVDDDNVCYLPKKYYPDLQGRSSFALAIQDPRDPTNNISRGSFNVRDIRKAFSGAYELLVNTCYEIEFATYKERLGKSILGNVIKYKGSQREFSDDRELAKNEAIFEQDNASIVSKKIQYEEYDTAESDFEFKPSSGEASSKGKVDDYMGLDKEEDDEITPKAKKMKKSTSSSSLDKDIRREYWLQKGNQLA